MDLTNSQICDVVDGFRKLNETSIEIPVKTYVDLALLCKILSPIYDGIVAFERNKSEKYKEYEKKLEILVKKYSNKQHTIPNESRDTYFMIPKEKVDIFNNEKSILDESYKDEIDKESKRKEEVIEYKKKLVDVPVPNIKSTDFSGKLTNPLSKLVFSSLLSIFSDLNKSEEIKNG